MAEAVAIGACGGRRGVSISVGCGGGLGRRMVLEMRCFRGFHDQELRATGASSGKSVRRYGNL